MKKYLEVGEIVGTHGIKGEMRVNPWADSPEFLTKFRTLYFDGGKKAAKVRSSRVHKNVTLVTLEGIDTIEAAELMRGKVLWIDRDDAKLPEGTYFFQDLIGLKVIDFESGEEYGEICDVSALPANDVWHIAHKDGNEYLIPRIDPIIRRVSLEEGIVYITVMKGLFGDAD